MEGCKPSFVAAPLYGQTMTPRLALALSAAVLVGLAGPATAGAHAAAPSPYSAPLRTAVRELPVAVEDNPATTGKPSSVMAGVMPTGTVRAPGMRS